MAIPANATLKLTPFQASISDESLAELNTLLKVAKLPPDTYEGRHAAFGVTHKWIKEAKAHWETAFDWRQHEKKINQYPQWVAQIKDDDDLEYSIHFVGVFSEDKDAIPLLLLHGWPGSFLEFLPMVSHLATLKSHSFHIIVPSLPGYAFSSPPPLDKDFKMSDVARILDKLMIGLGFATGYITQGGDIGAFISRILGAKHDAAKLVHFNFCPITPQPDFDFNLTERELAGLGRMQWFSTEDNAYFLEHAHRPSTIGIVLASNPLALLAWIGEKFLSWTDEDPPLDAILESVTLWWLTETFPRAIYPYREFKSGLTINTDPEMHLNVPFGYSNFAKELIPMPEKWVAATGNLVYYKHHEKGGHFAAMEAPEALASDIVELVKIAWKRG